MPHQRRPTIPRAISDEVLKLFHHLCAACGEKGPQLHHIDGDRTNNASLNLIPLCPNHHLTDAHDPTRPIDAGIVRLLRVYHDPTVLNPKFVPLFKRLHQFRIAVWAAIEEFRPKTFEATTKGEKINITLCHSVDERVVRLWSDSANELCRFTRALEMGEFFSQSIKERILSTNIDTGRDFEGIRLIQKEQRTEFLDACLNLVEQIEQLVMEQLRYQNWLVPGSSKQESSRR